MSSLHYICKQGKKQIKNPFGTLKNISVSKGLLYLLSKLSDNCFCLHYMIHHTILKTKSLYFLQDFCYNSYILMGMESVNFRIGAVIWTEKELQNKNIWTNV